MLFNSFEFLIFFLLVTTLYFILPFKWRWAMLLVASCLFYLFFIPKYILILFLTIIVDYFAGLLIEKNPIHKKSLLVLSIITNVGILVFFKYFNFFAINVNELAHKLNWNYSVSLLAIILPIGLSFHTFQAMSYTIEVYRGNQKAERHFGTYALYVMYYPQLVAGPIERPQNVLHQFHEEHKFNYEMFRHGLLLMLWGFFKKLVIADRLAYYVNPVFDHPAEYEGISILIAAVFFSFQIFCDFSGYSDIAIGASQIMGIQLMKNFDRPYSARSIAEFWTRWHISLSTWFKDYLYIPLGGNRVPKIKWYRNLIIVFLISGFWHGASWTFIAWGGLHALYQIIGIITKKWREAINTKIGLTHFPLTHKFIQTAIVFLLVTMAWIFFRADTIEKGIYMLKGCVVGVPQYVGQIISHNSFKLNPLFLNMNYKEVYIDFLIILLSLGILQTGQYLNYKYKVSTRLYSMPLAIRWPMYLTLIFFILFFGMFHSDTEFIYFQF
jgi:D-alanyl-lipoteichoic acid acyltransferase DltB (MBOAT superfamily)